MRTKLTKSMFSDDVFAEPDAWPSLEPDVTEEVDFSKPSAEPFLGTTIPNNELPFEDDMEVHPSLKPRRRRRAKPHRYLVQTAAGHQNERAAAQGNPGELDQDEWERFRDCFGGLCAYCGKDVKRASIEHVVPLHLGGANTIYNVVPACRSCNAKKWSLDPVGWLKKSGCMDGFTNRVVAAIILMEADQ